MLLHEHLQLTNYFHMLIIVLVFFVQWYYLLPGKHVVDSLNCVAPCILTFIDVSEFVAKCFKRAETHHSQQPNTSINIFYCANAHFLAAYQEFCIGMHWAGDPYLINFIWHTQTSTFITMSDFPMLIQFKATASLFLFFEERVIFSNTMSEGCITMSTFICGSLIQKNVYDIFKKAHSLADPTVLPGTLHKQHREEKCISVTLVLFVGCKYFAVQKFESWAWTSWIYTWNAMIGEFAPSILCPGSNSWR